MGGRGGSSGGASNMHEFDIKDIRKSDITGAGYEGFAFVQGDGHARIQYRKETKDYRVDYGDGANDIDHKIASSFSEAKKVAQAGINDMNEIANMKFDD